MPISILLNFQLHSMFMVDAFFMLNVFDFGNVLSFTGKSDFFENCYSKFNKELWPNLFSKQPHLWAKLLNFSYIFPV